MDRTMPEVRTRWRRTGRLRSSAAIAAALLIGLSGAAPAAAQGGFKLDLFGGGKNSARPLQQAQTQGGDAASRVLQLEEQVRQLNGQVEELNFQLLQLQEMLRKMQEDNEFRFQELEGGKRGALPGPDTNVAGTSDPTQAGQPGKSAPSAQPEGTQGTDGINQTAGAGTGVTGGAPAALPGTQDGSGVVDGTMPGTANQEVLQPRTLGTLTFDDKGNLLEAAPGAPVDLTATVQQGSLAAPGTEGVSPQAPAGGGSGDNLLAGYPDDPGQLYDLGYGYVEAGEYRQAEAVFREFSGRYPDDARIADASFWLGESVFAQRRYEEAAKIFLDSHKKYPQSRLGAQNLLKLGVSLAGMNQRELACATFAEIPNKYPDMSSAVRAKLAAEQKATNCSPN